VDLRANYRQGKLEGPYTLYKYGKVVETRFYKNNKLDGTVRQYDESKFTLKSEAEYKDG
jgi:antitoxin component YwqK of YwqJK toxin-antitoxin module